jgi:hypothetical protein
VQVPPRGGAAGGAGAGGPVPGGLGGRPGQAAGQPGLPRPVQPGEPPAALRTCQQARRALHLKLWTLIRGRGLTLCLPYCWGHMLARP